MGKVKICTKVSK